MNVKHETFVAKNSCYSLDLLAYIYIYIYIYIYPYIYIHIYIYTYICKQSMVH